LRDWKCEDFKASDGKRIFIAPVEALQDQLCPERRMEEEC